MKNTTKKIVIATLATMITAMPLAQASHHKISTYSANADSYIINVKVVSVTPIFRYLTTNRPTENCYNQRVTRTRYNNGDRGGRMLLGGIIGSVIGNNVGHGKSRKATAIVGALIGSQIGSSFADQNAYTSQYTGYEQRCETQRISQTRKQLDGYNVSYRFRGRIMTTQLPYNPGRRIRLNVTPVID